MEKHSIHGGEIHDLLDYLLERVNETSLCLSKVEILSEECEGERRRGNRIIRPFKVIEKQIEHPVGRRRLCSWVGRREESKGAPRRNLVAFGNEPKSWNHGWKGGSIEYIR